MILFNVKKNFQDPDQTTQNEQQREQQDGNDNRVDQDLDDAEPLRDLMADWFEGHGAHPYQDVIVFRTSDQLRHSN